MRTHFTLCACLVAVLVAACRNPATPPAYEATATVKDLMLSIIDTNADVVWNSVSSVSNEAGIHETRPQTEEDWTKVRYGALALAEAANLLMVPGRRVARPGEKSETPGVELEPEEMDALIAKDPNAFHARASALREAARDVIKAVDARDPDKVFEIGEHIERACENCHTQYWYPNEKIPPVVIDAALSTNSKP